MTDEEKQGSTEELAEQSPIQRIILNAGSLDGQSLIEMNNLAVGYFPTGAASVGVLPTTMGESLFDR